MSDLQDRFQKKPYGWREIDIAAVVAMLIYDQKVTIKYGGATIQPIDPKLPDMLRKKSEIGRTWVNNATTFFNNYVGKGAQPAVRALISYYRVFHKEGPLELAFLPASVQEMLRGLDMYDPAFGSAFYEGTWNAGFDHAEALSRINCPVLLIQADTSFMEDGTLNGAMSKEMADKAMELLKDAEYVRINAGHVTNLEAPDEFINVLTGFFLEKNN